MVYPRSHVTKKVQGEKKMMEIIDRHITQDSSEDPRECWLGIREELMKEGLIEDRDNEVLAKSYFADKMVSPVVTESTIDN